MTTRDGQRGIEMPADLGQALERALASPEHAPESDREASRQLSEFLHQGGELPTELALRCIASEQAQLAWVMQRHIAQRAQQGVLRTADLIAAGDQLLLAVDEAFSARVVGAFSWVAANDAAAVSWLQTQWNEGVDPASDTLAAVAACALAWRGHADEAAWRFIGQRLADSPPDEGALRVARRFPRREWVEPLRRLLHADAPPAAFAPIVRAWAAQSGVHDPDDIARELLRADVHEKTHLMLLGADVLQRIDSAAIVDVVLHRLGGAQARGRGAASHLLLRASDLWLPRAVQGLREAAGCLDDDTVATLQYLVSADTGEDARSRTMSQHEKQLAMAVAGAMGLEQLVEWLVRSLADTNSFVVREAAEMLGWWEAAEAVDALSQVLRAEHEHPIMRLHRREGAARGLSCIGGRHAIEAILAQPRTLPDDHVSAAVPRWVANAIGDRGDLECVLSHVENSASPSETLLAAAGGLEVFVWQAWLAQQDGHEAFRGVGVDGARERICAVLSGPEVRDVTAWDFLLSALPALGPSGESQAVLQSYFTSEHEELRKTAVNAAAWSGQGDPGALLALADECQPERPQWPALPLRTHVAAGLLTCGAVTGSQASDLLRDELAQVVIELADGRFFKALEALDADFVSDVIDAQMAPEILDGASHPGRNACAFRFAAERLARRLLNGEWREWYDENVQWLVMELHKATEDSGPWTTEPAVRDGAVAFLSATLRHEQTRARDAAAATLAAFDPERFAPLLHEMMDSDDWRDRAAGTEACALLEEGREESLARAQRDVDSRVRFVTWWAEERRREREAQQHAIDRIDGSTSVRDVFRWGQTLVQIGDDRALQWIRDTVGSIHTSPARAAWLDSIRKDVEKQWKDRSERHDREVPWD